MKFDNEKLKQTILKEGRTRKWLAKELGISRHTINSYILGRTNPLPPIVREIAAKLNLTEEDLYKREEAS